MFERPFRPFAGQGHAWVPVRGVISSPVLRLRDYPSESVPCKDPCMALPGKGAEGPFEQGTQITAGADAGAKVV